MGGLRDGGLDDIAEGVSRSMNVTDALGVYEPAERGTPLSAWLSQRRLFWAPESLPRDELKLFTSRLVALVAPALIHVGLAALFIILSQPWLAVLNVGSTLWFAIAIVIARRGAHRAGILLGLAEVCLHAPLMTVLVGVEAGYLAYNLAVAFMSMLLFPAVERTERLTVVAVALISGALLGSGVISIGPLMTFDPTSLRLLGYLNVGGTVVAMFFVMGAVASASDRAEARIERERRRSDRLLLNILPSPIAERLKRNPATIADAFQSVTVLFADVVGFTQLAAEVDSTKLVEMLNELFTDFDRLAERHGLEKIKTIGDAYMVVGGLPEPREDHARAAAQMALDMHDAVSAYNQRTGRDLQLRIGIHSGPVVAGVIGVHKFAYDIWGDTVNTASRMESHGLPGRTQVSDATRQLLGPDHVLEERGGIEVKGKGRMATWYLEHAPPTPRS